MTLEQLLAQLKALEAAARAASADPEYPDEIALVLFADGKGWLELRDGVYGNQRQTWVFGGAEWNTIKVAIQTAMIEVKESA